MFFERYKEVIVEKKSVVNINLDPALPKQRKDFVIPKKYLTEDDSETILNFSLDVIEKVSDYCCSIKANTQYFLSDTVMLKKVSDKAHNEGMIAILDHKLSDIGSTNESAFYWISKMGFDAFTFSPFAGNIQETVENAHKKNMGVIVLTLMSNPEAETFMLNAKVNNTPLYEHIASEVKRTNADGCVVGLTGFVKDDHIKNVQNLAGKDKILLLQGIGPQGGNKANLEKVKHAVNPLISLGREVIFSDNVTGSIKVFYDLLEKVRKA